MSNVKYNKDDININNIYKTRNDGGSFVWLVKKTDCVSSSSDGMRQTVYRSNDDVFIKYDDNDTKESVIAYMTDKINKIESEYKFIHGIEAFIQKEYGERVKIATSPIRFLTTNQKIKNKCEYIYSHFTNIEDFILDEYGELTPVIFCGNELDIDDYAIVDVPTIEIYKKDSIIRRRSDYYDGAWFVFNF